MCAAGRAIPPAQPQTEFTMTSVVPGRLKASSTCSAVVNCSYPLASISERALVTVSFIKD